MKLAGKTAIFNFIILVAKYLVISIQTVFHIVANGKLTNYNQLIKQAMLITLIVVVDLLRANVVVLASYYNLLKPQLYKNIYKKLKITVNFQKSLRVILLSIQ